MIENEQFQTWIDRLDTELVRYFADKDLSCNPLDRAMEYTLLAGGKRLRPLLTMVVCDAFNASIEAAIPFAMSSEMLHTYSLIHDDLPCMDDDDMRRGKPTNHVVFGEAHAILAGDALQSEAFQVLVNTPHETLSDSRRIALISELCEAIGRRGMVAGQVMDLTSEGQDIDLERLKLLHQRKTGGLFQFCIRLGGHLANTDEATMNALTEYANAVGLLFQVVDDLLDEEGSSESLGKTAGKDKQANKATFPRLMGSDAAHDFANQLLEQAETALETLEGKASKNLREIARYIRHRDY